MVIGRLSTASGIAGAIAGAVLFVQARSTWSAGDAAAVPPADKAGPKSADQATPGASFDCAKASTRIEKMICADGEAADLDGQVARAYRQALANAESQDAVKVGQRAWLTNDRNKCADASCLRDVYKKRLAVLVDIAARPPRPPESPFTAPKPAPPGTPGARKVKFTRGETTIERVGDNERITVRDAKGQVESESFCNPGDFDDFFALYTRLKDAAVREDRTAVVKLMAYPLRVSIGKTSKTFRKQAALLKAYDEIFTPAVVDRIRKLEPADLFCRDGSVSADGGMLWADFSGGDEAKVAVINR